jgi:hypothetical protein
MTTTTEPRIDITRLKKIKRIGTKLTAQCPACNAAGNDRKGEHFFMNTADGKFGCGALPGNAEHRREIFAWAGIRDERQPDPQRDRQWREVLDKEKRESEARRRLADTAKTKRAGIIARYLWPEPDVWENSPQRPDGALVEFDPRHFAISIFQPEETIWCGGVYHSGTSHATHWRTVKEWQDAQLTDIGPMVCPAIWKPGTVSRTAANVFASPFVVCDFDELDGRKPETTAELEEHVRASLAITRWLREALRWELAAIVWTSGKSVHSWFHSPPAEVLQSLKATAGALGIDGGLIGRPEHPCRLPGQRHSKTGGMSRVLWLQTPSNNH